MKPAPPKKPRRIRAVLIYMVPGERYTSLKSETVVLEGALGMLNRKITGSRLELAAWGSKKGCRVGEINSNKLDINTSDKISTSKVKRHFDFSGMQKKKGWK